MAKRNGILRFILVLAFFWSNELSAAAPISIRGKITEANKPLEGAYVGAHANGKTVTTYVMTDTNGQFQFRGLAPGTYVVFTRIPGFRTSQRDGFAVESGKEAVADFQVQPETDFLELVNQAASSELTESFPLSKGEKEALHYRCGVCHGTYYIAKSKFTRQEWAMIIDLMYEHRNTPGGDVAPPTRQQSASNREPSLGPEGSDDESLASMLARFRGPKSSDFPIKFKPRATGPLTRAVVTEYQLPRPGATPRYVLVDPAGRYVWYSDWRANYLGRIEISSGEVKEYPMPGRDDRPPGFQSIKWDPSGALWAAQIWSGRAILFDVHNEKVKAVVAPPQDWVRLGSIGLCTNPDGSITYRVADALVHPGGTMWDWDLKTGNFTELAARTGPRPTDPSLRQGGRRVEPVNSNDCKEEVIPWSAGGRAENTISYRDPESGKITEFPIPSPWGVPSNAVGDPVRKIGWAVPDYIDRVLKADLSSGQVTEYPLPSSGKEIRNIDIETSANPPAVWFVNQRRGRIVRFQEYVE